MRQSRRHSAQDGEDDGTCVSLFALVQLEDAIAHWIRSSSDSRFCRRWLSSMGWEMSLSLCRRLRMVWKIRLLFIVAFQAFCLHWSCWAIYCSYNGWSRTASRPDNDYGRWWRRQAGGESDRWAAYRALCMKRRPKLTETRRTHSNSWSIINASDPEAGEGGENVHEW